MRFMAIYKPGFERDTPPTEKEMADMGALIGEMMQKGVLITTDGLQHSKKGARVAIEWTKRFLSVVGHGESEIRLMQDAPAAAR